jgi:hypothetical protein
MPTSPLMLAHHFLDNVRLRAIAFAVSIDQWRHKCQIQPATVYCAYTSSYIQVKLNTDRLSP